MSWYEIEFDVDDDGMWFDHTRLSAATRIDAKIEAKAWCELNQKHGQLFLMAPNKDGHICFFERIGQYGPLSEGAD